MSKELEALDNLYCAGNLLLDYVLSDKHKQDYEIVKQALNELQAIKNSKPSEAINYLDAFINEMTDCLKNPKQYVKNYDKEIFYKYEYTFETTIKQALIKARDQEKVINELKIFVECADKYKQHLITLAELKHILKEIL